LGIVDDVIPKKLESGSTIPQELGCGTVESQELGLGRGYHTQEM